MQALGKSRIEKRYQESVLKGRQTGTRAGARLFRDLGGVMAVAIDAWKKKAASSPGRRHGALEHLQRFPSKQLSAFTLKIVLDSLTRERSFTSTAMQIGARCEDEERYTQFKADSNQHFDRAKRRSQDFSSYEERRRHILKAMSLFGIDHPRWSKEERCKVGVVLLQLCIDECGVLYCYTVRPPGKKHHELRIGATQEVLEWVEDVNARGALMAPMQLPFVEEPLDWVSPISGGFHTTDIFTTAVVKTQSKPYLKALHEAEMPVLYDSLNHLQKTTWSVNQELFEMFDHFWGLGLAVPGLPSRDSEPIPAKPPDIQENETARKEWRKMARAAHDKNNRKIQDRLAVAKVHWVCENYKDLPHFYYCHQLDWRGRAYPVSYFLHPQGNDLVKGLLQFGSGKRVETDEARRWHRIHGANCWGLDKQTFEKREAWVLESHDWVMKIAEDPLETRGWMDADEPWQFLAWCLDYAKVVEDPLHESRLVIHQDATQSGIQIYSLLLRDRVSAISTNVVASEEPQDLYRKVAEETEKLLKASSDPLAEGWLKFGITRAACKRPVMTRVYNATRHSARTYIAEWAGSEDKPIPMAEEKGRSSLWFLTELIWEATNKVIASTSRGQDWLTAVGKIFAKRNQRIEWKSPLGFPIRQWYPKWKSVMVKTSIGEIFRQTSLLHERSEADGRKMAQAFAPNFVHSLDAAAMMQTVYTAKKLGVTHVAAIHDSFGTHAADSEWLAKATRQAYIDLFSADLLSILRDQLQLQLPDVILPELPHFGDLDVQEVHDSPYFFS